MSLEVGDNNYNDKPELKTVDARLIKSVRSLKSAGKRQEHKSLDLDNSKKEDDENEENSFEKLTAGFGKQNLNKNNLLKSVDESYALKNKINSIKNLNEPNTNNFANPNPNNFVKKNSKIHIDSSQKLTTTKFTSRINIEDNKDKEKPQTDQAKTLFKSSKELSGLVSNQNKQNFLKSMTVNLKGTSKYGNTFRETTRTKHKANKLLMDEKFLDKLKVYGVTQIENDNELKNKFNMCSIPDSRKFIQENLFDDKIFMYKLDLLMTDTTFNKQKKEKYFKLEIKKILDDIILERKQYNIFTKLDENLNKHCDYINNFDFLS